MNRTTYKVTTEHRDPRWTGEFIFTVSQDSYNKKFHASCLTPFGYSKGYSTAENAIHGMVSEHGAMVLKIEKINPEEPEAESEEPEAESEESAPEEIDPEAEKTIEHYNTKVEELEKAGLGEYIDMAVDSENVYPLKEGDKYYWRNMCVCLLDSVRIRAEENGIDISDYGF